MSGMGGEPSPTAEGGLGAEPEPEPGASSFVETFAKTSLEASLVLSNPVLGVIAGLGHALAEASPGGEGPPPDTSGVGPQGGPVDVANTVFRKSPAKKGEMTAEEEDKDQQALAPTDSEAAERRRRRASKRTGYWSTRMGGGGTRTGSLDVFTPSLFSID